VDQIETLLVEPPMIPAVEQQSMQSVLLARQQPGTLAQVMMA
jgi:hypothetical protein